jgi:hypothetical protein
MDNVSRFLVQLSKGAQIEKSVKKAFTSRYKETSKQKMLYCGIKAISHKKLSTKWYFRQLKNAQIVLY